MQKSTTLKCYVGFGASLEIVVQYSRA